MHVTIMLQHSTKMCVYVWVNVWLKRLTKVNRMNHTPLIGQQFFFYSQVAELVDAHPKYIQMVELN